MKSSRRVKEGEDVRKESREEVKKKVRKELRAGRLS